MKTKDEFDQWKDLMELKFEHLCDEYGYYGLPLPNLKYRDMYNNGKSIEEVLDLIMCYLPMEQ